MERVDSVSGRDTALTCNVHAPQTFRNDLPRPWNNCTSDVHPHGPENRMVGQQSDIETIQRIRTVDIDAYPDLGRICLSQTGHGPIEGGSTARARFSASNG